MIKSSSWAHVKVKIHLCMTFYGLGLANNCVTFSFGTWHGDSMENTISLMVFLNLIYIMYMYTWSVVKFLCSLIGRSCLLEFWVKTNTLELTQKYPSIVLYLSRCPWGVDKQELVPTHILDQEKNVCLVDEYIMHHHVFLHLHITIIYE
jgi:hypothetical protein